MSKFVRNVVVSKMFEGDSVTATFRPLSFPAALEFKARSSGVIHDGSTEEFILKAAREHVVSFSGLKASDGTDVTLEEFFSAAYFIPLLTDLTSEWMQNSMPGN